MSALAGLLCIPGPYLTDLQHKGDDFRLNHRDVENYRVNVLNYRVIATHFTCALGGMGGGWGNLLMHKFLTTNFSHPDQTA